MTPAAADLRKTANAALDFAAHQVRRLLEQHPDYFPLYTRAGKWCHDGEAWTRWGDGYLAGQIWIHAKRTGDPWWRSQAEHYSRLIEPLKSDRNSQSHWSLFWPSWKRWFDLTGDPAVNAVAVEAGRTLATRFNPKARHLASFVSPQSNLIDNMMSVGIVFYAGEQTGDPHLLEIAVQHCLTTRRHQVRGDGSIAQEGVFDPETGECLRTATHQGLRPDSSWARGQAWAIYGFGNAYAYTRDPRFLRTALACADFYIERTPGHGVPPNDWEETNPALPYESSAAAVAANGMLRLSKLLDDRDAAATYRAYAHRILSTLCTGEFLASETPGWEGVLKHGIYHLKKTLGVDESVIWGDYFFTEALEIVLDGVMRENNEK